MVWTVVVERSEVAVLVETKSTVRVMVLGLYPGRRQEQALDTWAGKFEQALTHVGG